MSKLKTEVKVELSKEAVILINEIWELIGHITGNNPTADQMRTAVGGKDEYQLRKLALQLRDQWRSPGKKSSTQEGAKEGGEGTTL
jgi:hypothetical protein